MVFEPIKDGPNDVIACPHQRANYGSQMVAHYVLRHNAKENVDQARFATLLGKGVEVKLVNDTEFPMDTNALRKQANVRAMLVFGLWHLSGAFLNKDRWQIERFSLQYCRSGGPANLEESKTAELFLPHVAKALRIGRPLSAQNTLTAAFDGKTTIAHSGVCLLSPNGYPIAKNDEFDRIVSESSVFRLPRSGQLTLRSEEQSCRFQVLVIG